MSPPHKPDTTLKSLLSSLAVVTGALLVCGAVVAGWLQLSPTLLLERAEPPALLEEPGRADYANVTARLVGAMRIESFSSASASGPHGERVVGRGLMAGGEAICNCACWAADDFAFCRNTAKTTVGVATYAYDPALRRWEARGLRYFGAGSPGLEAGRRATNFVADGVLPRGPGGPLRFYSTYVSDTDGSGGRSAEIVRARTSAISCAAAPLCDVQCRDEGQYAAWKMRCGI